MKASTSTLALGLLLSVAAPPGAVRAADAGAQILLERANFWRSQQRFDLAAAMIDKVLALDPGQPDALYQAGLLAQQRGDTGAAQGYFDRLRQSAASGSHAAKLVAAAMAIGSRPIPGSTAAPAAGGVAMADAKPTTAPPAPMRAAPELVVASIDSDDLTPAPIKAPSRAPAPPSPPLVATVTETEVARSRQMAALPVTTVSDGDTEAVVAAPGRAGDSASPRAVQVAQLELMAPAPVGGYQRPIVGRPYSPDDTLDMDIDRTLAQIQAETSPQLVGGIGFRAHGGDSGLNRLTEIGAAIEGSFSPWLTGTARLTVLPVYLTAGSVSSNQLFQFGANPVLSAKGSPLVGSGTQNAGGVGILGGYSFQDLSAQFGTSPLGFPVTNLVGTVAYAPKFFNNTLSVRIEGMRQPVTDSVLSYAGTRASLAAANAATGGAFGSNTTWGGVVKTGGHVTLFYDDTVYGAYGGAGLATLTGTNVPDNDVIDALLGVYFRPYKTDDDALRVGVALYYTGYNRNLSGFTFGQGGYFSPRNFESLTFPVEYTGHTGNWSYLAAVAVGVQHSNQRSSPFFPNNPFAQSALAATGGPTTYPGSTSTSPAFNLKGQVEYAIDDTLSIGASASLDNGKSYTEGIGKIYLRKTFDWLAPIGTPDDQSIVSRDIPQSRL
ncbi:MAG TPA: cellulose synthase subunit BcsC-related outer membrane protein [Stellaceae bacterium]|nr:cellulose synthase subunit BcsC-related outer membrane protein [Stellaceae bacterium]